MTDPIQTWTAALAGSCAIALIWAVGWAWLAVSMRRNDVADIAWGLLFPLLAILTGGIVVALDGPSYPRPAIAVLISVVWGVRLATHITRRFIQHDEEDRRYAELRARWAPGSAWWRSFVSVFLLQAAIALVVAQPLVIASTIFDGPSPLGWLDWIAIALALAGLLLETTADRQLAAFLRRKRAGEVDGYLTSGVWAWSRHPNYAGDALLWWGLGLLGCAAALDVDEPLLIIPALIGPLVMTGFLRYGSGVPITERNRSGPAWETYVARTSTFIPWPPKRTD